MVKTMRTVLAVDELLGRAVERELPGISERCPRQRMRDEGDDVVRSLALAHPGVLVIGAKKWNPLPWLERWRLPFGSLVVIVLPRATKTQIAQAERLGVFSVLSSSMSGIAKCVASESVIAHACRVGLRRRGPTRVLQGRSQPPPTNPPRGRVLPFR